jgi:hypothetical protein
MRERCSIAAAFVGTKLRLVVRDLRATWSNQPIDLMHQRGRILALGYERSRKHTARRRFQDEQHPLRARELGRFVDEELVQLVGAAQRIEPQAGIDEALERLAQGRLPLQMRGTLARA